MNILANSRAWTITLVFFLTSLIHHAQTAFVDFCRPHEFEYVYQRTDLMTVDIFAGLPEKYGPHFGYSRDFYGNQQFQNYSFITWRVPNGLTPNAASVVGLFNSTTLQSNSSLYFSISTDNINFVPLTVKTQSETDSVTKITRTNFTMSFPFRPNYFRAEWGGCSMSNCFDYYFPSVSHLCIWNDDNVLYNDNWCFNPSFADLPSKTSPNYCGARPVDTFLDWDRFRFHISDQGMPVEYYGHQHVALDMPHNGKYETSLRLLFNNSVNGFWEWAEQRRRSVDLAGIYSVKTLYFKVTASAGSQFFITLAVDTRSVPYNSDTVNTTSAVLLSSDYAKFTPGKLTQTFRIPYADFKLPNGAYIQSIRFMNFTVPAGGSAYYRFRPIFWLTNPSIQAPFNGRARTGKGILKNAGNKYGLQKTKGQSHFIMNLDCMNISQSVQRRPFTFPAFKFSFIPTSRVSFRVVFSQGGCNPDILPRKTASWSFDYHFQRDEYIGMQQDISISMGQMDVDSLNDVSIRLLDGEPFDLINLRFSDANCFDISDPLSPNLDPIPPRSDFSRHPLAAAGIVYTSNPQVALKRSVGEHLEL